MHRGRNADEAGETLPETSHLLLVKEQPHGLPLQVKAEPHGLPLQVKEEPHGLLQVKEELNGLPLQVKEEPLAKSPPSSCFPSAKKMGRRSRMHCSPRLFRQPGFSYAIFRQ